MSPDEIWRSSGVSTASASALLIAAASLALRNRVNHDQMLMRPSVTPGVRSCRWPPVGLTDRDPTATLMSDASSLDAVWQIFHAIPDLATPAQVESSLRSILDDPTLELLWWDWERSAYVDVLGEPVELRSGPGRTVTSVDYESRKIGAIVHDSKLLELPVFLDTFVPTMRIAMERDRLHRDLVDKLEELNASRLRLVEAADVERGRIQRNLHDGAQQRLVVVLLELRRLAARVRGDSELEPIVARALEEAEGAVEDLRHLARGLQPPMLLERGLAAALRSNTGRAPLPIDLELTLDRRLPPAVETAAYYVCAEAITNTVKHARASTISLGVTDTGETLLLDIRDDGIGGAGEVDGDGTGLRGLKDRVEALGGRFEVESPTGSGTRIAATFPLT